MLDRITRKLKSNATKTDFKCVVPCETCDNYVLVSDADKELIVPGVKVFCSNCTKKQKKKRKGETQC